MASYLLRRSGIAVGLVADLLGWKADLCVQVGIGSFHQEIDVLHEEWPSCRFIGFEPHPGIVSEIERKGDYPGTVIKAAISNRQGTATLYLKNHHSDGSSLHSIDDSKREEVSVTTLDSVTLPGMYRKEHILLWIDCEGSELAALQGGYGFCKYVEFINVECTAKPYYAGWADPREIHKLLIAYGFVRQHVHTHRMSAGQYDAIYVKKHLFNPLYSCDPF
jgi:FkbM family methyltransferase